MYMGKKVFWHWVENQKFWWEEHQHLRKFPLKAQWGRKVRAPLALRGLGCLGEESECADEICVLVQKTLSHNIAPEMMRFAGIGTLLYIVVNFSIFSHFLFFHFLNSTILAKTNMWKVLFPCLYIHALFMNHIFAPFFIKPSYIWSDIWESIEVATLHISVIIVISQYTQMIITNYSWSLQMHTYTHHTFLDFTTHTPETQTHRKSWKVE